MGLPAFFIRLQGCDQKCSWCDSAGTWHKDWIDRSRIRKVDELYLSELASHSQSEIVVITGGEPTLWNLEPLVRNLREKGKRVHLETAGHHDTQAIFDWITLSPKIDQTLPITSMLQRADEYKCIIAKPEDIEMNLNLVLSWAKQLDKFVWLHPEWSQRENPNVLRAICEAVSMHKNVRAGYQIHKLYNVDKLDPRADERLIPLGGKRG